METSKTSPMETRQTTATKHVEEGKSVSSTELDVIQQIKLEHDKARTLLHEYKNAKDDKEKIEKLRLYICEVVQHAGREEIVLYPLLRKHLDNGEEIVNSAVKDHQAVTDNLYKLDQMDLEKQLKEVDPLLHQIHSELEKHMVDEENNVLPQLHAKCSKDELKKICKEYVNVTVTTRPHPSAPREGLGAKVAHMASAPIDAARDAARSSTEGSGALKKS